MTTLKIHDIDSAPAGGKELLENSQKAYGMIPGLHGVLAGAPKVLEAYQNLHELFTQTSFNEEELTVVWQSINVAHECHYCVPAHTGIAHMMKVDDAIITALREETPLENTKLEALRTLTLKITENRGNVSQEDLAAFYDAGYEEQHVLEIILGLSQKVISNYVNHIANTPVDSGFQKFAWSKKA